MGTRHLTFVMIDGEYKIAQYGQWDGYPGGQGLTVLEFLHNKMDRPVFEAKCRAVQELTPEENADRWAECGASRDSEFVSMDIATTHYRKYPENSRDTGAGILALVQNGPAGIKLFRDIAFAADSLMCEWAYVIDLDKNTFEVYEGFVKEPIDPGERFASLPLREYNSVGQYYQIKLVKSWPLDALPDETEFLSVLEPEDDAD